MSECNFVKPGKGQALYKCKLKNLVQGTQLDRTYKSGDSLEAADIVKSRPALYSQGDQFVSHGKTQRAMRIIRAHLGASRRGSQWLKEGTDCSLLLFTRSDHDRAAESYGAEGGILRAGGPRRHGHETRPSP